MSNLKVIVGSTNLVKVNAIKNVFANYQVEAIAVKSKVSQQPISDQETIRGALNRALGARRYGDIGIGLEGGVQHSAYGMLLVNYGALVDEKNKVYIAGGTRIVLPTHIAKEIYKGRELGDIMEEYTHKSNLKYQEGAIGVFTGNFVKRVDIFEHIGKLLYGQMITGRNDIKMSDYR
jgi:inosine/xanthosine triphosphatase